jgi:polyhydroxyalkanoate synthesis regulator phasin
MSMEEVLQKRGSELVGAMNEVGDSISSSVNLLVKEGKVDVDQVANSFIRLGELSYSVASELVLEQREGAQELIDKVTRGEEIAALQDKISKLEKEVEGLKKQKSQ